MVYKVKKILNAKFIHISLYLSLPIFNFKFYITYMHSTQTKHNDTDTFSEANDKETNSNYMNKLH